MGLRIAGRVSTHGRKGGEETGPSFLARVFEPARKQWQQWRQQWQHHRQHRQKQRQHSRGLSRSLALSPSLSLSRSLFTMVPPPVSATHRVQESANRAPKGH